MYTYRNRRSPRYFNNRGTAGEGHATSVPSGSADSRGGRCVALVDARFMAWLGHAADRSGPGATANLSADGVATLRRVVRDVGGLPEATRVYWYTDREVNALIDGVLVRPVADAEQDGGLSMTRAMSADIQRLAQHQAADHLVVVSDDERLWAAIDDAQLHGLSVALLCDDSVGDYSQLQEDDPSWARLLAQADRRIVWDGSAAGAAVATSAHGSRPGAAGMAPAVSMQPVDREGIMAQLAQWWDEEPETQRIDLQSELQYARGIPQEVDRQLLVRLSRTLGHPLTWPEKKIMREGVRRLVLGDQYTPYQSPADPTGQAEAFGQSPEVAQAPEPQA
ncbi:MAG TPA: hypothetical protein VFY35_13735 [Burkholderiaceae bacterium]|nr:hypothetical protein [Burkholderiaceae bacterium]